MSNKRKREPVPGAGPGVYKDKFGYAVIVWHRGKQSPELRIPLSEEVTWVARNQHDSWAKELKRRRDKYAEAFKLDEDRDSGVVEEPKAGIVNTLREDFERYIAMLPEDRPADKKKGILKRTTQAYNRYSAAPFLAMLGDRPTMMITSDDIRNVMAKMTSDEYEASTVGKARGVICRMYNVLFPHAPNPTKGVEAPRKIYSDPRGFDIDLVREIIKSAPDLAHPPSKRRPNPPLNLAKIRARFMLETSIPPATIMRMKEANINLRKLEVLTHPRRKGKGMAGTVVPLSPKHGKEAAEAFIDANAFGVYNQGNVNRCFKRWVKSYKAKWQAKHKGERWPLPANVVCYDTRHTFLSEVSRQCKDLATVMKVGGLSSRSLAVAQRYTLAAADENARAAVQHI